MKNLILATSALALLAGAALADGHAKTIRLGTEGAYPPYNFLITSSTTTAKLPVSSAK